MGSFRHFSPVGDVDTAVRALAECGLRFEV